MESIFDDLDKEYIAPQNFSSAIGLVVVCMLLSYLYCFMGEDGKHIVYFLANGVWIYLQFFFKTYLQNFRAAKAVKWLNLNIVANIATTIALLVINSLPRLVATHVITDFSSPVKILFGVVYLILVIFSLVVSIGLGLVLQKITSDFIGLLHRLGIAVAYLTPLAVALSLIFQLSKDARHLFSFYAQLPDIMIATISIVPEVILVSIYYRAMKHKEKDIAGTPVS